MQLTPTKLHPEDVDASIIAHLLKDNPQIKTFGVRFADLKILKETNDLLPNLHSLKIESLSANYSDYHGDTIHFNSVKNLDIKTNDAHEIPERIVFNQLDKLTLKIGDIFSNNWFEFIHKQNIRTLNEFHLETDIQITNEQYLTIPDKVPKLKIATFYNMYGSKKLAVDDVMHFLNKTKHLNSMRISMKMYMPEEMAMREKLESNWEITSNVQFGRPGWRMINFKNKNQL